MKRLNFKQRSNRIGYIFLGPFILLFFTFSVLPVIISAVLSFTDYNMLETPAFVGLENYKNLFLNDQEFVTGLKNTFIFAFITGPITFVASFMMAWFINRMSRFRTVFSLAFYAPSITSGVALSAIWLYFFSSDSYGLFNNILMQIGILSEPIKWTLDTRYVLGVVMFIAIWMGMGTGFLTFLAGFQNLSPDIFEAGMIDGIRNSTQELIYMTLPQMKPQLLFGAINSTVAAFSVFDISVSVAGLPSPDYAAHTLVTHLYDFAFIRFEMGYASAVSVMLFLLMFVLGRVFMKVFSER